MCLAMKKLSLLLPQGEAGPGLSLACVEPKAPFPQGAEPIPDQRREKHSPGTPGGCKGAGGGMKADPEQASGSPLRTNPWGYQLMQRVGARLWGTHNRWSSRCSLQRDAQKGEEEEVI